MATREIEYFFVVVVAKGIIYRGVLNKKLVII